MKITSNPLPDFPRHPFPRCRHRTVWAIVPLVALLAGWAALSPRAAAERAQTGAEKKRPRKHSYEQDFVVFGTVFTEEGFALPGAEIRVRQAGGRKVRRKAWSDRRGEFAVRVPQGAEYELSVKAKGFEKQERKIDARNGNRVDLVFQMKRAPGGKK